jgi:hypothetical protein
MPVAGDLLFFGTFEKKKGKKKGKKGRMFRGTKRYLLWEFGRLYLAI